MVNIPYAVLRARYGLPVIDGGSHFPDLKTGPFLKCSKSIYPIKGTLAGRYPGARVLPKPQKETPHA